MRTRHSFCGDRRGTAVLEFAILAPAMLALIFGLIELANVAFARSALESATMAGARYASTQSCLARRKSGMESIVTGRMHLFRSFNHEPAQVEVLAYSGRFVDVKQPEPFTDLPPKNGQWDVGESYTDVNGNARYDTDMGKNGSVGGPGDVVTFKSTFKLTPLVPFIFATFHSQDSFYRLTASTAVRNEPVFRDQC